MNYDIFWQICEEELLASNCKLIHFGACLVNREYVINDQIQPMDVIGRGHNMSLRPEQCCLKQKGYNIGTNPGLCHAVHAEWMAVINALSDYSPEMVNESSIFIVGRYPDGRLWKSNFFACTVCVRLLKYAGVKYVYGKQFDEGTKCLTIDEALESALTHIIKSEETRVKNKFYHNHYVQDGPVLGMGSEMERM